MKTPEKPKRLCESCDHYEVCQAYSHTGVLHELNANRCGLYSDRTHDRKRIAVLEHVIEEGSRQIAQLETQVPRWIRVEERLPPVGEVLISHCGYVCIAWHHGQGKFETGSRMMLVVGKNDITHWMPLPQPPKEE